MVVPNRRSNTLLREIVCRLVQAGWLAGWPYKSPNLSPKIKGMSVFYRTAAAESERQLGERELAGKNREVRK